MQTSLQETPSRSFLLESSNNKSREKFQSQKSNPFLLASNAPLECHKFFPWCVSFMAFRASCLESHSPLLCRADRNDEDRALFITTLLYSTALLLLSTNDIPGRKRNLATRRETGDLVGLFAEPSLPYSLGCGREAAVVGQLVVFWPWPCLSSCCVILFSAP